MATTSRVIDPKSIFEPLLTNLKADIDYRRIQQGVDRISSSAQLMEQFDPSLKNAAEFVGVLAQWCDLGQSDISMVRNLIAKYDKEDRSRLPVSEYLHLRMAEGLVSMKDQSLETALDHFELVVKLGSETAPWDVLTITHHWMARCQRKKGQYAAALTHIRKALELQTRHGHAPNQVPARVLESLILFDLGDTEHAIANLRQAEVILDETDDYETLGHVQCIYGRILRRELRYGQAIKHYTEAIESFRKRRGKDDANVARTLVDMSQARIQMARQFRTNIEGYSQPRVSDSKADRAALMRDLTSLYERILTDLETADEVFNESSNARGLARVHLSKANVYLEMGDLEVAAEEAAKAYELAASKIDYILMSFARNLQCMVENGWVEEQIEGWVEHAIASREFARDALELAGNTQDRRLLAMVNIWYGLVLSSSFFNERESAHEAMDRAATYIDLSCHDHIWQDFQNLKRRLLENAVLEPRLVQWAQGEIDDKTFRQLEEEFANLVIPRIWEQEGRKISRVASRLSIAPRKVRQVLSRLGFLETQGRPEERTRPPRKFQKVVATMSPIAHRKKR